MASNLEISVEVKGAWKVKFISWLIVVLNKINMPHFKKAVISFHVKLESS